MKTLASFIAGIVAIMSVAIGLLLVANIILLLIGVTGWILTGEFYHIIDVAPATSIF